MILSPVSWYAELAEPGAAAGAADDAVPGAGGGQRDGGPGAAGRPPQHRLHRRHHRIHGGPHSQHCRQASLLLSFIKGTIS